MKTVVFYAYFETTESMLNLNFFVKHAITEEKDILFVIIINGDKCNIQLPQLDNCIILRRPNTGFDFGAYAYAINYLTQKYNRLYTALPFDYYIFMNSSVTGPFLPNYYPKDLHWSHIFISKLNDKVKLVGTSIVCLSYNDDGGYGPKVEGFCFATDKIGFNIFVNDKTIFMDHPTKYSAIIYGEYGLTKEIVKAGYTIDCLLYKYQGIDWTKQEQWPLPNFPSRRGTYDGISIHPFEVVFHKCFWKTLPEKSGVAIEYFSKYLIWNQIVNK